MEGMIRWYVPEIKVQEAHRKNLKTEQGGGWTRHYFEEKFSLLSSDVAPMYDSICHEVSAMIKFVSATPLDTGIYVWPPNSSCKETYEKIRSSYHENWPNDREEEKIKGLATLEIEDIESQKYSLHIRARKEKILREMVILIRHCSAKPAICFGNSDSKEG